MIYRISILAILILLGGCAIRPMALHEETTTLDVSSESIILMTLDISRSQKKYFQLYPQSIGFVRNNGETKEDKFVYRISEFEPLKIDENSGKKTYLLRLAIPAGEYRLTNIPGQVIGFPFSGGFLVPLQRYVSVPGQSVVYMGKIDVLLRPRVSNEFRAGPVIPLISQATTGISTGTFDVFFKNTPEADLKLFREQYPVLRQMNIETSALPSSGHIKNHQAEETEENRKEAEDQAMKETASSESKTNE